MESSQSSPYSFTAVDTGVDWLTCTARGKDAREALQIETSAILREEASAGVEITSAGLRDYVGWRGPGFFIGSRRDDDLVVLTSTRAARQWRRVAQHATNVSRLDLQVTVWTHGEQPVLSRWYYQKLKRADRGRGRPREMDLRQTHPQGDTLYVNKRVGDNFGRVYDYASAHKQGEARTLWRYEVELKRRVARSHCNALLGMDDIRGHTEQVVGRWFKRRGILPTWSNCEFLGLQEVEASSKKGDLLRWFESSLSKTIARAIKDNGVVAVFEALHLSQYLIDDTQRRSNAYADNPEQAVHDPVDRGAREPVDYNDALGEGPYSLPGLNSGSRAIRYPFRDDN